VAIWSCQIERYEGANESLQKESPQAVGGAVFEDFRWKIGGFFSPINPWFSTKWRTI